MYPNRKLSYFIPSSNYVFVLNTNIAFALSVIGIVINTYPLLSISFDFSSIFSAIEFAAGVYSITTVLYILKLPLKCYLLEYHNKMIYNQKYSIAYELNSLFFFELCIDTFCFFFIIQIKSKPNKKRYSHNAYNSSNNSPCPCLQRNPANITSNTNIC